MQADEIGSRTSAWEVGVSGTLLSSSTNAGFAGLTKWPTKPLSTPPPVSSRQDTYGMLPENVMSGRVEGFESSEIGWPLLTSSKCAVEPLPTRRDTKIWCVPPRSSSHVTHGTVGLAGFMVPAATRGSSAPAFTFLLSEQPSSAGLDRPQAPPPAVLSSTPWPALPTETQWKPPSALTSLTPLAANTMSLSCRVAPDVPVSYQTTHGTESCVQGNAMSGS